MDKINLNGTWKLKYFENGEATPELIFSEDYDSSLLEAKVPGDVHADLVRAGKIPDPYFSDNVYQCKWVAEKDWCYIKEFYVSNEWLNRNISVVFKGIDTFADIYLNGVLVGKSENMFLQYEFDITKYVKQGNNKLAVVIKSIKNSMKCFPEKGFFGCFNVQRIFIRKVQCHFSWDWAPEFPGTGIWGDVIVKAFEGPQIKNVAVRTLTSGDVTFFINLNKKTYSEEIKDYTEIFLEVQEGNSNILTKKISGPGFKNHVSINIQNPQLWWPLDMGSQYLYSYKVSVYQNGCKTDETNGRFGIREIEFEEKPRKDEYGLTCQIKINGQPLFLKGANWVPLDIMTGEISEIKYRRAIEMAAKANFNALRVWGGGMYEKDIFYDLCDELGIVVWQDFAFACSDIPDDYPGFIDQVIPEFEYQIERLRNHPSIVLWCGGNEKTGSFGKQKSRGDRTVYYMLRGIAGHLDPTRPYFPSSPWGYTDTGNDHDSGDSHCNSYQASMNTVGFLNFRDKLSEFSPSMASEIAVQGCCSVESLKKFIPEEKLWPVNDIWDLHFTRNPYDSTGTTFVQQQLKAAEELFGGYDCVDEFVKKSMCVHSEFLKADVEYHRSRKGNCSAAMMWMYSDVWPCGTWALVDYYLEPKAAYYSAKRAFQPLLPLITKRSDGIKAFIVNDTLKEYKGTIILGQASVNGEILKSDEIKNVKVNPNESICIFNFDDIYERTDYLFIHFEIEDGTVLKNTFFHKLWKDIKWPTAYLSTLVCEPQNEEDKWTTEINIISYGYARMVHIAVEECENAEFSDNYFDMEDREEKTVIIRSDKPVTKDNIKISHWALSY